MRNYEGQYVLRNMNLTSRYYIISVLMSFFCVEAPPNRASWLANFVVVFNFYI
jgi:hypothetical protein